MDIIAIADQVQRLTGIGTEYLVVKGEVLAKFQDGMLVTSSPRPTQEDTIIT